MKIQILLKRRSVNRSSSSTLLTPVQADTTVESIIAQDRPLRNPISSRRWSVRITVAGPATVHARSSLRHTSEEKEKHQVISASADGGPRSRVYAH